MNLRRTMYKLQTALCKQGRYIKINQMQTYSEKTGRMVTKFVLTEKQIMPYGHEKTVKLLETNQVADVVKFLAAEYGGG